MMGPMGMMTMVVITTIMIIVMMMMPDIMGDFHGHDDEDDGAMVGISNPG